MMCPSIKTDFIAVGGNRHPAAADWDTASGLVAFAADRSVAVWPGLDREGSGICALLSGHTDKVNVVKFYHGESLKSPAILSGSVDRTIRIWSVDRDSLESTRAVLVVAGLEGTVNTIAVDPGSGLFVAGSTDAKVRIWKLVSEAGSLVGVKLLQTLTIAPRFFPLALALSAVPAAPSSFILAVGGTRNIIQTYVAHAKDDDVLDFSLQATLTGHEGWIRSLAFAQEKGDAAGDLLLASASQDKYIRLWRVHHGQELPPAKAAGANTPLGPAEKSLSNKAHRFEAEGKAHSLTFEALLLGHDDWVYSVCWLQSSAGLQLLSASADGSLAMWHCDAGSGVWICLTRLGEVGAQKGATTATGSTGGYWVGLWSPSGSSVASLGRTGGWRLWHYINDDRGWQQAAAVSGHVKPVTGIAWAPDGRYLLSTSSDQTTRLFAQWRRGSRQSWHELSRPQIHGYDLNCIDILGSSHFISGADEKLLRVFEKPRPIADILRRLCGAQEPEDKALPDAASIPVLGLSNKAVEPAAHHDMIEVDAAGASVEPDKHDREEQQQPNGAAPHAADHPPTEDSLSRHTLWPEKEKLYGHGFEISAVATSHDGTLVATACRASAVQHAVIRVYETHGWREVKPALEAHSLTVTRLRFARDDRYILSVGRDRQWTLFRRDERDLERFTLVASDVKGHARMILDAAWAPIDAGRIFLTASRDKSVKLWQASEDVDQATRTNVSCIGKIAGASAATALDCLKQLGAAGMLYFAVGYDDGSVRLCTVALPSRLDNARPAVSEVEISSSLLLDPASSCLAPMRTTTQLAWRPKLAAAAAAAAAATGPEQRAGDDDDAASTPEQLAVASEDGSVRIYTVEL